MGLSSLEYFPGCVIKHFLLAPACPIEKMSLLHSMVGTQMLHDQSQPSRYQKLKLKVWSFETCNSHLLLFQHLPNLLVSLKAGLPFPRANQWHYCMTNSSGLPTPANYSSIQTLTVMSYTHAHIVYGHSIDFMLPF